MVLMVRRRVADIWREAAASVKPLIDWAVLYRKLFAEVQNLATRIDVPDHAIRGRLFEITSRAEYKPPRGAQLVRERLVEEVWPLHALLVQLAKLPWKSEGEHPVVQAMATLGDLYRRCPWFLPAGPPLALGSVWQKMLTSEDRDLAFRALEVATLLGLRKALRNGSVWIEHSFSFRSRERLFIPRDRWISERSCQYARLSLPEDPQEFLAPLLERVRSGDRNRPGGSGRPVKH